MPRAEGLRRLRSWVQVRAVGYVHGLLRFGVLGLGHYVGALIIRIGFWASL